MSEEYVYREAGESYCQWKARQEYQESKLIANIEPIVFDRKIVEQGTAWIKLRHPQKHHRGWKWINNQWKFKGE